MSLRSLPGGWVLLCSILVCFDSVIGFQVYLREITVHKSHEGGLFDKTPEVYLECSGTGNGDKIDLPTVKKIDEKYEFGEEDVAATHVDKGACRSCKLREKDGLLSSDDTFGDLEICEEDFEPDGQISVSVEDEFDAVFECMACLPPPPSPSPPPPSKPPAPPKIVYLSSPKSKEFNEVDVRKAGSPKLWQSPWFVALLVGLTLFGLIFGGVSYRWYLIMRANAEDERMREVEAILGDPEVDFEEMVENDQKAFNLNFWRHIQLRPKAWTKIGTKDSTEEDV
ncbi:hypothetical protein BSKO_04391 [Bryopsis sp. KO-2023]|nr:hypothetical protein BSKO_04391 [Bryopsis sp. KO-2023]